MINLLELVSLTVISLRAGPGFFVCFVLFCFAYSEQRNEGVRPGQALAKLLLWVLPTL